MFGIRDKNIWIIFYAIFLVGIAYGVYVSLLAAYLDANGFSKLAIGSFATWFASGLIAFSIPSGALLRRVSAKTMLAGCLLGYAACAAAFPYLRSYGAIAAMRALDGAFSVGVWVSCETVLLARAERRQKALVTSLYAMAIAIGYIVGPIAARIIVAVWTRERAFVASSALAVLAALLVAARLDGDLPPDSLDDGELRDRRGDPAPNVSTNPSSEDGIHAPSSFAASLAILWRIKTSCFATFAYGYFQSSVVLFLPLYLMGSKGMASGQTILVPAFFAAGMLLFSNIAARVGDKVGHLRVMRALAVIGLVMICAFVALTSVRAMWVAVFIAGATLASISPLSLALQGVVTPPSQLSRANAIYNLFYALGMLVGPPVSGALYASAGGATMLFHLASIWVAFVVFTAAFASDDPAGKRANMDRAPETA